MLRDAAHYVVSRWRDERSLASVAFDEQLGVETARWTLSGYEPTTLATLEDVLNASPIPEVGTTFIDVGAGKGRVLLVAARRPFAHVLGVEIDPGLAARGQRNLRDATDPLRVCADVSMLEADAATVSWPLGPLVLYLYNPVPADVLYEMIRGVEASIQAHPRPCAIVYVNPLYIAILTDRGWNEGQTGGQGTERWVWLQRSESAGDDVRQHHHEPGRDDA